MAEYLIQDTSLQNIADQVRTLIGTDSSMTPANMASNIQIANNQINTQTEIIEQIKTLLYDKITQVNNDRDLLLQLSLNSLKKSAEPPFSHEYIVDQWNKLIEEIS